MKSNLCRNRLRQCKYHLRWTTLHLSTILSGVYVWSNELLLNTFLIPPPPRGSLGGLEANLKQLAEEKRQVEAQLSSLTDEIKQTNQMLNQLREALANSDMFKRNIEDTLKQV